MCTAVIEVPQTPGAAVRVLAVRDEDPARAWDAPGRWWADTPNVVGVRDRLAGGAWLAAAPHPARLSLILNRPLVDGNPAAGGPGGPVGSRGALVLEDVQGLPIPNPPRTAGFNLLSVGEGRAELTAWDGAALRRTALEPGVHMIAHHDIDDAARTPRIAHWLPEFRALAGLPDSVWWERWTALLAETTRLDADDDRAIVRDNRAHGYPTQSLLACLAEVRPAQDDAAGPALRLDTAVFAEPAQWGRPAFDTVIV